MESCTELVVKFDFKCKRAKQKTLIDVLLHYSKYDLKSLAAILTVPVSYVLAAYCGNGYLIDDAEKKLVEMFLILFSD